MHPIGSSPSLVRRALPFALLVSACASRASDVRPSAETPAAAPAPRMAEGWGLVAHSAGLDALLADPRDAGLRRALSMLDDRLLELPAEFGKPAPPPGSVELLCDLLSAPWTFQLALEARQDGMQPIGVRAQWTVHAGSAERAADFETRLKGFLALLPMPSTSSDDDPELTEIEMPAGSLFHGAHAKDGTFLIAWGQPAKEEVELANLGLPKGVAPVLAFELEPSELIAALEPLLEQAEPDFAQMRETLEFGGLLGKKPLGFSFAVGEDERGAHYLMRYRNWAPNARTSGMFVGEPIPAAELRMIPADATLASITRVDPEGLLDMLHGLAPEAEAKIDEHLKERLGLALGADILQPLGKTIGFYMSDTTGGGGLASSVLFVALDDEARFAATLERFVAHVNEHLGHELDGRAHVRTLEHGGARCFALEFPGLPVPLEPTLAIEGGHLFAAATPQALYTALDHVRGSSPGLPGRPGLAELGLGSLADLQSLQFNDTPRFAREGYGMLGLVASALANGVRTRTEGEREPGLVLPSYHALVDGARPTLMLSRIQGDDLVVVGAGDGSAQVHLAATLAWLPEIMSAIGSVSMLVAVATPGVMDHMHAAVGSKAQADIWAITAALNDYAIENGGRYPDSLEALVTPDENGKTYLDSETVPLDPWGKPYLYELVDWKPHVYTLGADGVAGGEGENRDLDNLGDEGDEEYMEEGEDDGMELDEPESEESEDG